MTPVKHSCIIEADTILTGVDPQGRMMLRHEAAIRVDNGMIAQIGTIESVAYGNDDLPRYGGPQFIALPGLVNGHHHFGVTPLMQGVPFAPLELWLPQFRAMRRIPPRLDTLYAAIEMLESGTTTVQHIHSGFAGPAEAWNAQAEAILGAYGEAGMRAGFCFMIRDQSILGYGPDEEILAALPPHVRAWISPQLEAAAIPVADLMAFHRDLKARLMPGNEHRLRFNLAPANLHWVSDEGLQAIFGTARSTGAQVHMHLAETRRQAMHAQKRFGRSAVAHLAALGVLGPAVTFGHGNWMSRDDLDLIAQCGCSVCHNASSGLRLGSGIAPVNEMRRRGIPVALGIDQSNIADDRDMTLEMKLVWALHRETGLFNDRPDAAAVLQMATEHGAMTAGFAGFTGRLEPGYQADIVLMDRAALERPFVNPRTPVAETILHRGGRGAIRQVFTGGRLVVDNGRIISVDRDAILAELAEHLSRPETAAETAAREAVAGLMPVLSEHLGAQGLEAGFRSYRYNAM